jgi:hypothetical protein
MELTEGHDRKQPVRVTGDGLDGSGKVLRGLLLYEVSRCFIGLKSAL